MSQSTLAPVFAGLRYGQHALVIGLTAFAVVRAFSLYSPRAVWALPVAALFVAVYLAGALVAHRDPARIAQRRAALTWLAALTVLWAALVWLSPGAAYLVFPLFFLYLALLPGAGGIVAVALSTGFAIVVLGADQGFSAGGVIGPSVGAVVAVLIGLAYRVMRRQAEDRERLLAELVRTRQQLADTEREQGALAERARLARDIHDTVAQGLSSIQMLLHAAERDTPEPGLGYLRLARETAADSLAETRQIIRELTPGRLDDGLGAALGRLGEECAARSSLQIEVTVDPALEQRVIPMEAQTALLRVAQGALSNAIRHAEAERASVSLVWVSGAVEARGAGAVALRVRDDGCGFDAEHAAARSEAVDSFGLRAMRERIEQLGGSLEVTSTPGRGTEVVATIGVRSEAA